MNALIEYYYFNNLADILIYLIEKIVKSLI
jgi:hypothetical protein